MHRDKKRGKLYIDSEWYNQVINAKVTSINNNTAPKNWENVPNGSLVIIVVVVHVVIEGAMVHVSDGVLVHGCVGLRSGVERRWDAVAGFAAVITVSIVHSTVWIII